MSCGLALAALLLMAIAVRRVFRWDAPPVTIFRRAFWRRPLYAAAAWTFRDSWVTNITAAGTLISTVLVTTGTVSPLFPGVQLDRFAILIAAFGAIVVAAPLVFGIANAIGADAHPVVADDATIKLPPDWTGAPLMIDVPDGATITFPRRRERAQESGPTCARGR